MEMKEIRISACTAIEEAIEEAALALGKMAKCLGYVVEIRIRKAQRTND